MAGVGGWLEGSWWKFTDLVGEKAVAEGRNGGAVRGRMRGRIDVLTWLVLHLERDLVEVLRCLEEQGYVHGSTVGVHDVFGLLPLSRGS